MKIQITALEFSRDGTRLAAVSGLPDYSITMYDTETGERLKGIAEKLPDKTLRKIAFNPSNASMFAIMTTTGISVYTVEKVGEYADNQLELGYKLVRRDIPQKIDGADFIWDKMSRILVADRSSKRVIIFNTKDDAISELESKEFEAEPLALLLTQTQIIVSLADATLKWYEYAYDGGNKLGADPQQELTTEYGAFTYMVYNNPMTKIIGTTQKGTIVMIPCEAQSEDEEEDQGDVQPDKAGEGGSKPREKPKILPAKLGDFLTSKIMGIKELPGSTQVVTLSEDGTVCLWENTSMQQLARFETKCYPTCLEIDTRGEAAFVGCADGCVRVLDLSDRMILRLVKIVKLFSGRVTRIKLSPDGVMLAACSSTEKGIYFVNSLAQNGFSVAAYLPMVARVNSLDWLQVEPGTPAKLIAILSNSLLAALTPPADFSRGRILAPEQCPATYSVVDNGSTHLICSRGGDILITGADRKIKKYDMPDALLNEIDVRKPASPPAGEFPGHGLEVQTWAMSFDGKLLASGSRDGTYQIRVLTSLGQAKEGRSHSVNNGGVTAVAFAQSRNMIYIGGGDGSFLILNMSKEPLPTGPKTPGELGETMKALDEIEDKSMGDEKVMLEKWRDEERLKKEEEKEKLKTQVKLELHGIKESLRELLLKNEAVQDLEKLGREEFLVDRGRKERMLVERDQESVKLRKTAAKENLRAEVLKQRIKERTWDTMEIQSTGCRSLHTDQIIFNFHIRKQSKEELELYNKLANVRRLEIKDFIERRAEEILVDKADISKESEHYIVNRFANQPIIQEELQEKIAPSIGMQQLSQFAANEASKTTNSVGGGPEKAKVTYKYRRPGLLAHGGKRSAADVEDKFGKEKKEEQKMDDIRLTIKQEKKEIEYFRKNWRALEGYELIYEPFELQTNARKRAQIVFIKEIIRRMMKEFNKEFETLLNYKSEQIALIKEKNQKIEELQKDLKESVTKFEIKDDKREQPEHILKVEDSDIKIPKYLTKEEKAHLEEEKRKDEERLRALQSDTLGRRGVVTMMGGVLEIKRELDELEKALVRQPWMDLPESQMTEAQRQEFTKFRQMEEDLKERKLNQQKAWRQELNKARNDIDELCQKFEERMNKLMKRRLFMQLRIYEQELYIIRLNLSLYEERLLREGRDKTEVELRDLMKELEHYEEIKNTLDQANQELAGGEPPMEGEEERPPEATASREAERNRAEAVREGEVQKIDHELAQKFQSLSATEFASCKDFVELGREALRKLQERERKLGGAKDHKEDTPNVFKRSPYVAIDKEIVDRQESYNPRADNVFSKLTDENFRDLIELRLRYVGVKKHEQLEESEKEAKEGYNRTLEMQISNCIQTINQRKMKLDGLLHEILQYEENIEVIIRIKQGQVEISLIEIAPNLEHAVLLQRKVILDYNKQIREHADILFNKLRESSSIEKDRKKNDWKIKVLDKEIEYLDTCTSTVMQERIGRHPVFKKRDELPMLENDKIKMLDKQIAKLKDNANRRIKTINGKVMMLQKQIEDKKRENDELEQNARKKEESVKQRVEILDLSSGGGGEEVKQEAENKMKYEWRGYIVCVGSSRPRGGFRTY